MLKLKALIAAGFVAAVSLLPAPAAAQNQQTIPQVTVSGALFRWTGMTLGAKNAGTMALLDASGNQIGIAAAPVRTDPTGSTAQPVTGTFWPYTLGQQVAGSSVPVVLPAAQITTLTPPTTVTANLGTLNGAATAANQTGGTQKTQIVDGSGNVIASTSNNLNVQCANCSGSGVSTADAATFTASTSLFAGTGGFYQTTATSNALTNGQQGMWQMTANRAGFVNLRNASGTEVGTSAAEIFIGGRGTAGSAAGGVLTVQGSASGTAVPVSIASVPSHAVTNAGTFATQPASATAPVSTMNSSSANAGINAANAFVFDDTSPTAITENNFGFARMSANRNVYQTIRDAAGNERGANVDASNRLTTAPSLVSGSVASGAYASGAFASGSFSSGAFASGSYASGAFASGSMVDLLTVIGTKNNGTAAANSLLAGGVYNSTPLTLTNTQQSSLQLDANGYLKTTVTNTNNNGQAAASLSAPVVVAKNSGTGATVAGAAVGTAGTPSSEVVSVQGVASGTPMPVSAPATGLPSTPGTLAGGATFVSGTTSAMTGTTSTQVIALVSSQRIYVTRIKCNNSHASVDTLVQIRDGSAGTVLDTLAAGKGYGGEQGTGATPLFWTTAGTALYAQNVTTGASVICTASGYSG